MSRVKRRTIKQYTGPLNVGNIYEYNNRPYQINELDYLKPINYNSINKMANLNYLRLKDLREIASNLKIRGRSKMNKTQLKNSIKKRIGGGGVSGTKTKVKFGNIPPIPVGNIKTRQYKTLNNYTVPQLKNIARKYRLPLSYKGKQRNKKQLISAIKRITNPKLAAKLTLPN